MTDELRHLLLVAQHGTFTAAARHAHLSQPALTASIKRLEDTMGARLLDRGPGGASPTAAGAALLPWAEAALSAIERGRRAVAEVEGLRAGEVVVAAGSTACAVHLPPFLRRFHQRWPGVRLTLRETTGDDVRARVERGETDLGIVAEGGTERWLDDELVLVAAPGVNPRAMPFLSFTAGANHRALQDRHFPGVDIAMELSSLIAVRAHAEIGLGIALLSRAAVRHELDDGRLVEVADPRTPIRRTLSLLHLGLDRLSPGARALRDVLLETAERPATSPRDQA